MIIEYTRFPDIHCRTKEDLAAEWQAIVEALRNVPATREKTGRLIKFARFGNAKSSRDSLKWEANLIEVTGVEADYDAGELSPQWAADRLQGAGVRAVVVTTWSHEPDRPRWRVFAPLSDVRPLAERDKYIAKLNGVLDGVLSPESFVRAQAYFVGHRAGSDYQVIESRGECIDLVGGLAERGKSTGGKRSTAAEIQARNGHAKDHLRAPNVDAAKWVVSVLATDVDNRGDFVDRCYAVVAAFDGSEEGQAGFVGWAGRNAEVTDFLPSDANDQPGPLYARTDPASIEVFGYESLVRWTLESGGGSFETRARHALWSFFPELAEADAAAIVERAPPETEVTAALIAIHPDVPPNLPDEFFRTPELQQISRAAWLRMCSPDAVLNAVLARVAASRRPAHFTAETFGGEKLSLNHCGANVGLSGAGKGVYGRCAADLWPMDGGVRSVGLPRNSEAFAGLYVESSTDDKRVAKLVPPERRRVLTTSTEGDILLKYVQHGSRSEDSQALLPTLCQAAHGEQLGRELSSRSVAVPEHEYALGGTWGFQPGPLQDFLINEGRLDRGVTQRFLVLSAHAATAMTVEEAQTVVTSGEKVEPLPSAQKAVAAAKRVYALTMRMAEIEEQLADEDSDERGLIECERMEVENDLLEAEAAGLVGPITFPPNMLMAPIAERAARSQGHADVYADGGRLSHRPREVLKLAALFCLLHGRTAVTWEDHALATGLFDHGQRVLDHQESRKASRAARQSRQYADAQAGRAAAAHIAIRSVDTLEPIVQRRIGKFVESGGRFTPNDVYRAINSKYRKGPAAKDAVQRLILADIARREDAGEITSGLETVVTGDSDREVLFYIATGAVTA